jgi:molybdenum cofactor cytidylyltransferase
VVASRYEGTVGVPAVFARDVFSRLQTLAPDEGCKGVIRALSEHARFIECPDAAVDVDTPADYARARARATTATS